MKHDIRMSDMRWFRKIALCGMVALSARGTEISPEEAGTAVQNWADRGFSMGKLSGRTVASAEALSDPETGAAFRIVKFDGGGFVVTTADDRVDPIVAFSETGDALRPDDGNPFWALVRGNVAAREAAAGMARSGDGAVRSRKRVLSGPDSSPMPTASQRRWAQLLDRAPDGEAAALRKRGAVSGRSSVSDIRVDSFVASRWGQSTVGRKNCWNACTPNHDYCGCVATAVAQVMRYWRKPDGPVEAKSQVCRVQGENKPRLFTMYGGTYDWDAMPLVPTTAAMPTDAQCLEIGKLLYDIGVAVKMEWGDDGSLANLNSAAFALKEDFGYESVVSLLYDAGYYDWSLAEFAKAVIPNLDARCPVVLGIENSEYGHAAVADGYGYSDGDFFLHVNFGWTGISDAWYCPPDLEEFTTITDVHCNIFPEASGTLVSGRVLDASGSPVSGASVSLVQNGRTVAFDQKTDDKGIYAFIVPSTGVCSIRAAFRGSTAAVSVTPGKTVSMDIIDRDGTYYQMACAIGNRHGNDIVLPDAPGESTASGLFWHEDRDSAVAAALRENKRIFLVAGRNGDPATSAVRFSSCEDETVRAFLTAEFVAWYNDLDERGAETSEYVHSSGSGGLPLLCILEPGAMDSVSGMTSGFKTAAELLAFLSMPTPPASPVYRFYSKNYKGHFFTIDEDEMWTIRNTNRNWSFEGTAYRAFTNQVNGTVPLHRFYSKGYRGHFFTIDADEAEVVKKNRNWKYEGVAYYVYPQKVDGSVPVFRFWSKGYRHHFYTINESEKNTLIATNPNWAYEGEAFYALPAETAEGGVRSLKKSVSSAAVAAAGEETRTGGRLPGNGSSEAAESGSSLRTAMRADASSVGATAGDEWLADAAPWTLWTRDGTPIQRDGATELDAVVVESRLDAPDAAELRSAETAEGDALLAEKPPVELSLRLSGAPAMRNATLWSASDGTVSEDDFDGTLDFDLPATGVWHWLRVADDSGNESISVWLRATAD